MRVISNRPHRLTHPPPIIAERNISEKNTAEETIAAKEDITAVEDPDYLKRKPCAKKDTTEEEIPLPSRRRTLPRKDIAKNNTSTSEKTRLPRTTLLRRTTVTAGDPSVIHYV